MFILFPLHCIINDANMNTSMQLFVLDVLDRFLGMEFLVYSMIYALNLKELSSRFFSIAEPQLH